MDKTEIHINDSYKNYPGIEAPKQRFHRVVELSFMGSLTLKLSVLFDANDKNLRIVEIKTSSIEEGIGSKTDISINTNNTFHEGKQAIRFTINFSNNTITKNEVGSCIFKLTKNGDVIQYTQTENVSKIQVVNGDYDK